MLELELHRRRIPFVKYGGLRYLEAAHVKDFIALLRLADNGADDVAWFRVLQLRRGCRARPARGARWRRSSGWWRQLAAAVRDEVGEGRLAAVPTGWRRGRTPVRRCPRAPARARMP